MNENEMIIIVEEFHIVIKFFTCKMPIVLLIEGNYLIKMLILRLFRLFGSNFKYLITSANIILSAIDMNTVSNI